MEICYNESNDGWVCVSPNTHSISIPPFGVKVKVLLDFLFWDMSRINGHAQRAVRFAERTDMDGCGVPPEWRTIAYSMKIKLGWNRADVLSSPRTVTDVSGGGEFFVFRRKNHEHPCGNCRPWPPGLPSYYRARCVRYRYDQRTRCSR